MVSMVWRLLWSPAISTCGVVLGLLRDEDCLRHDERPVDEMGHLHRGLDQEGGHSWKSRTARPPRRGTRRRFPRHLDDLDVTTENNRRHRKGGELVGEEMSGARSAGDGSRA